MSDERGVLHQLHAWLVVIGSAAVVAFLGSVFVAEPEPAPRFALVPVDGQRCLVDEDSGTAVGREDGAPECLPAAVSPVRVQVAHR